MSNRFMTPVFQAIDASGDVLAGAKLSFFITLTSTPKTVYSDSALTTPLTQPVVADAAGRFTEIFLDGTAHKAILTDSNDVQIAVYDPLFGTVLSTAATITGTGDPEGVITATPGVLFQRSDGGANSTLYVKESGVGNTGWKATPNVEYTSSLAGAVTRTIKTKLDDVSSPLDFGAVGDGSTDDTAAFALFETAIKGSSLDLIGKVYLVTAEPNKNDYFNGAFKVGSTVAERNKTRRNHPFENPVTTVRYVDNTPNVYRGLNVGQFPTGVGGNVAYLWREAPGHGNENVGTTIKANITKDQGYSFVKPTVAGNSGPQNTFVFSDNNFDTRNFATGVMSGRLGAVAARVDAGGAHTDPVFLFSDDGGVTWSSNALTGFTASTWNFHSKIVPYPTSAGGDDTNGFACYFYKSDGSGIGVLTTVNNGNTWSETVNVVTPSGSFAAVTEMSVERVGTEDKWVMAVRTGSSDNFVLSTSTNLTTWTTIVDSGLFLGSNPPELLYEDGKIWMLSFSRQGNVIVTEYENALIVSGVEATGLFAGTASFPDWRVITALKFWPTGYPSVQKIKNRWYALMNVENYGGSTQSDEGYLAIISSDTQGSFINVQPNENLFINGSLRQWPLGTTLTGTSRDVVVPGMTFARGSSVGGWTITRRTGNISPFTMRIRRDDTDAQVNDMIASITLPLLASRPLAGKQVTVSMRVRAGSGFSAVNSFLGVQLRQTNNTSEQSITNASGTFTTGDTPVGTSSSGLTISPTWQKFILNPSRIADDSWQISLRILWIPTGIAVEDWIDIEEIKIEQEAFATPFGYDDYNLEKAKADRFTQVFNVITPATTTAYYLFPSAFHVIPTVSLSAGSVVGSPTIDGFRLDNVTGAPLTSTVTARAIF